MSLRQWLRVGVLVICLTGVGCGTSGPPGGSADDDEDTTGPAGDDDDTTGSADDDDGAGDDDDDGADDDADDDTGSDDDDDTVPDPLAGVSLYINAGDSAAAGYNAAGNNSVGGGGYARLLVTNHADHPQYGAANLTVVAGGVDFHDVSESGAQSGEILENLRDALDDSLPQTTHGDVLVTISAGGNDFNDSIWTMVTPIMAEAAAAELEQNLGLMLSEISARYAVGGKQVHAVLLTIHDPTGGTGSIPGQFDEGFCETLQSPYFQAAGGLVLSNLDTMNGAIASAAAAQGGQVADLHAVYLDHGMNESGNDRWIDDDCAHPTDVGHHEARREIWGVLTGHWY
jgi:hypothetical protein